MFFFRLLPPLLTLIGFLLSLSSLADAQPAAPATLRVVTYNIHHAAGNDPCSPGTDPTGVGADCGLDPRRIADILLAHRPDVVALQEVDRYWKRSGGVDQPAELARLLEMTPCYGANLRLAPDLPDKPMREYGVVTLSRYPVSACRNELLPKAADAEEQRGLLRTEIDVAGQPVVIWNTHLHVRQPDRLRQGVRIAEVLASDAWAGQSPLPRVLMGDLNARPGSAELEPLLATLQDAWALKGAGEGLTSPAVPGSPPRNRIDYILVGPGLSVASISVDTGQRAAFASDHYPVVATLILSGK